MDNKTPRPQATCALPCKRETVCTDQGIRKCGMSSYTYRFERKKTMKKLLAGVTVLVLAVFPAWSNAADDSLLGKAEKLWKELPGIDTMGTAELRGVALALLAELEKEKLSEENYRMLRIICAAVPTNEDTANHYISSFVQANSELVKRTFKGGEATIESLDGIEPAARSSVLIGDARLNATEIFPRTNAQAMPYRHVMLGFMVYQLAGANRASRLERSLVKGYITGRREL